jgi:ankyrin repeat protein
MFFGLFDTKAKKSKKLRDAASGGLMFEVKDLLRRGADINGPDPVGGENPLTLSIFGGHNDIAELLISSGANLHFVSKAGNAPLLVAAYQGDKNFALCKRLLEAGAQVNFGPSMGDRAGLTALYLAASRGAEKVCDLLLDAGADTSAKLVEGQTLMYAAAMGGSPKIIRTFSDRGIEINAKDLGGRHPIHIAAAADHPSAIKCFLALGVPVDQLSEDRETPLFVAATNDKVAAAKALIENGANASYAIKAGALTVTPLLAAGKDGHDRVVKLLLLAGADPEARVQDNKTILDYVIAAQHKSTVKLMQAHLNAKGKVTKTEPKQRQASPKPKKSPPKAQTSQGGISIPAFTVVKSQSNAPVAAGVKEATRRISAPSKIEFGVFCTDLRYDEEDHGDSLPPIFQKARAAWIKSKNDPNSPHYLEACRLLTNWFECRFKQAPDLAMAFEVNQATNTVINRKTRNKEQFQAVEYALDGEPKLKRFEVVSVDFREEPSNDGLVKGEAILRSPEVGLIAIFETKTKESFRSAKALSDWIEKNDELFSSRFEFCINDKAITTIEIDEDGDEVSSSHASWSGGDPNFLINFGNEDAEFFYKIKNELRRSKADIHLDEYRSSPLKTAIILAKLDDLRALIKDGSDFISPIDGLTPIQICLMSIYAFENYFRYADDKADLEGRFKNAGAYREALITILKHLLAAGGDVNVNIDALPTIALIEMLADDELSGLCRAGIKSASVIGDMVMCSLAERGDIEGIKEYIRLGATVDPKDSAAVTPLMSASQGPGGEDAPPLTGDALLKCQAAVKFLLSLGANVNARTAEGDTAIGDSVRRGNASIVQLLLDAGANTTGALPGKQTLLSLAKRRNHVDVIRVLGQAVKTSNQ